ncbi:MAG: TolC family protein [Flavobacterium sp.]|nr:TolC family protein [Flavobacterium sp.]
MKIKKQLLLIILFFGLNNMFSQETILNLKEAIDLAITKSNESVLANTKIETKKLEYEVVKNSQYPDFKISGQYLRLAGAKVDLKSSNPNSGSSKDVNELIIGQANLNMPLFSGFKIQNSLKANENIYKAEQSKSLQTKEEIAMKVVEYYANLYRAQKSVKLITESLKTAEQRAKDFEDLEKNGLIARNDLLKAQLQQSKVQLSLDEMKKNVSTLNYYLITLMKLPEVYKIGIDEHQFDNGKSENKTRTFEDALQNRKDLEFFSFIKKAGENNIKIAKSGYFPQIALKAGYTALQLQNVATITNALSFGLGFNYDLSSIFKISKDIKLAKNKLYETNINQEILTENIKIQNQQALENYNLTLKQNSVYEQAVNQASENYRIVKDKNDNGLATTTELLEADTEQLNSKLNFALSRANSFLKYYEMQYAAGTLTTSFN